MKNCANANPELSGCIAQSKVNRTIDTYFTSLRVSMVAFFGSRLFKSQSFDAAHSVFRGL